MEKVCTISEAIVLLKKHFGHYRVGPGLRGHDSSIPSSFSLQLAEIPIEKWHSDALMLYMRGAFSSWKDATGFKACLPFILLNIATRRDWRLVREIACRKIVYAQWRTWPLDEQVAIEVFFKAWWNSIVSCSVSGAGLSANDGLCSISQAIDDLCWYTNKWISSTGIYPRKLLLSFLRENMGVLSRKSSLVNQFWNDRPVQMKQVVDWIKTPEVITYLVNSEFGNVEKDAEVIDWLRTWAIP